MMRRTFRQAAVLSVVATALAAPSLAEEGSLAPGALLRDTLRDGSAGPEMVVLPAGTFVMGSPESETGHDFTEGPQAAITIARPFAVARYELTWDEWEQCVAAGGCEDNARKAYGERRDAGWPGDAGYGRGRRPVINVAWDDAAAYVAWLSAETGKRYRLLSEAEWEYAARAGSTGRFSWGEADPVCEPGQPNTANFSNPASTSLMGGCNGRNTEPVGYSAPNAFGLYDMHGNVREWVQDCFHVYLDGIPADGSPWMTDCARGGEGHVFRGGSFTGGANQARSASRQATIGREVNMGFRIARKIE